MHEFREHCFRFQGNPPGSRRQPFQFRRDHAVVPRSPGENFSCQLQPCRQRRFARALDLTRHALEIRCVRHHRHALEILRRRSQHRRSADVNVLDQLCGRQTRFRRRRFKRIEIHRHQIDRRDSVFRSLFLVFRVPPPEEQPSVHFGV